MAQPISPSTPRARDSREPGRSHPQRPAEARRRQPTPRTPSATDPATSAATDPATSPPALERTYECRGRTRRKVLIAVDEAGEWLVYDIPVGKGTGQPGLVVDQLGGFDDVLGQALALADDYLSCQRAFHAGGRDEMPCPDPLPKPSTASLALIHRRAELARRAVLLQHERQTAVHAAA